MRDINRREFLKNSLTVGAAVSASLTMPALGLSRINYRDLDAVAMANAVRTGEISAETLVKAAQDAIEALNPKINAVVTTFYDHAYELAKNADPSDVFPGVPYLIKDLSDYRGFRTTFGSRMLRDNISTTTAPVAGAAVKSGLIPLGKASTPEYGLLPSTEPLAYGPTRNPWNLDYSAGGSSGGSGAAVAAGMVPIALSSDGGGSIRIPACNCGVFGLKVSRGRNVGAKNGPLQFAVKGAISRSVRDSAAHLVATQQNGKNSFLPPVGYVTGPLKRRLKIGLVIDGIGGVVPSDEVQEAVLATAELCQQLGHQVQNTTLPESVINMGDSMMDVSSAKIAGLGKNLEKALGRKLDERDLEPWTLQQISHRRSLSDQHIQNAVKHIKAQSSDIYQMFDHFDLLLMPVLATRAKKLGYIQSSAELDFDEMLERNKSYVSYTTAFNVSGNPAMSVPLYWTSDGIPIGSQFAAGMGQEELLLALAYELEAAQPWRDRHPPVSIW